MNNSPDFSRTIEEKQTRREMCRGLVRWLILGGLGLIWAVLSVRSERNSHTAPCAGSLSCGGCPLLDQCDIPQAVKTRENSKRQ
ncbi:MAG: hypothetical protein ABSE63_16700 [Thermoguttaceae bacterium]